MKHSTGPWNIRNGDEIEDANGFKILTFEFSDYNDKQNKVDARRIVACVNVCEGIDIERLEEPDAKFITGLFGRMASKAITRAKNAESLVEYLKQQRDELLAALKEAEVTICKLCKIVNPQHENCTSCTEIEYYRKQRNGDAIAKTEGGKV